MAGVTLAVPRMAAVRLAAGIYETVSGDCRMTVTDVTPHTGRLDAWVEVHHGRRRLTFGDMNLRGARTVGTLAKACAEAAPTIRMAWLEWLGEAVYEVVHDTLEGTDPVELTIGDATPPGWLVKGLVEDEQATSLIGFGETGKSLLALAVCCTLASGNSTWLGLDAAQEGPTLTCDWEATDRPHRWRLAQLCRGVGQEPPRGIYHRHEALPFYRSLPAIARHLHRTKAVLLVIDSVMRARSPGGDYGQQGTAELYGALAQLDVPVLLVDHRAKHSDEKGDAGPWGAVQNFNNLRLGWAVRTMGVAGPPPGADIRLRRVKANNWGHLPDHAWHLRFSEDNREARFNWVDPAVVLPGGEATTKKRVHGALLAAGYRGMSAKEVAVEVGTSDNNARAVLSALKKDGLAAQVGGRWVADEPGQQEEAPF